MAVSHESCDVLVIGGGPAGSTISALLSEKGWHVALLEKDRHPRFHIGESLLPHNMPIFDRLGVMAEIEAIGVVKRGADFPLPHGQDYLTFDFSQAFAPSIPTAFQVKRAEFDHILLRNTASKGTRVLEGVTAGAIELGDDRGVCVHAVDEAGQAQDWRARFLVDASGRDTLLASKFNMKRRNRDHNSAAIFTHYSGAKRRPGEAAGNISLFWFAHGWMWMIPLRDGLMSFGAVCWADYLKTRDCPLEQFLDDTIALCPPAAARLKDAKRAIPVTATGNYSYFSKEMFGEKYLLVGDAYAFIDPVFSSGVYLAMHSAALGADTVDACLRDPKSAPKYLRRHATIIKGGLKTLSWLIYRFTDPAVQKMFVAPRNIFNLQSAIVSVLAGDVFGNKAIRLPLAMFKVLYWAFSLTRWRATWRNSRRRRA